MERIRYRNRILSFKNHKAAINTASKDECLKTETFEKGRFDIYRGASERG